MPLINSEPSDFDRELTLLENAGLSVSKRGRVEERFYTEMLNGGLSPEEVVATIGNILNQGENSSVKLAAAKMALSMYMHPAFVPTKERDRVEAPSITINVSGGNLQLNNVLRPQNNFEESKIV